MSNRSSFIRMLFFITSALASILFSMDANAQLTGGWNMTGEMSHGREGHTATLLQDGKVIVTGGQGAGASCEIFAPATGTWTALNDMAYARKNHTATLLQDGKVLVTGSRYNGTYLATCEIFNPGTGTWTTTGSMAQKRYIHTATLLQDGKVLVTGGYNGSNYLTACEIFDPATGAWTATGSMTQAREGHTTTLLQEGKVFVAGGYYNGTRLTSCEIFDPTKGTWTVTESMVNGRAGHTATLLQDGKVLVTGGFYNSYDTYLVSCEIFDFTTGTWTTTGSMAQARAVHTATLLQDGKVLVTGGKGVVATCEIFNQAVGTWESVNSMAYARGGHTATLFQDGKLLVAGGNNGADLASCELFDYNSSRYVYVDVSSGPSGTWTITELAEVPPDLLTNDVWRTDRILLRKIPAGTFVMGSPEGEVGRDTFYGHETQHTVTLSKPFYIGVFEVTQKQYENVMGVNPSYFSGNPKRPVENISWNKIRGGTWPNGNPAPSTFMGTIRQKLSGRLFDLPTEAQWEYACRAGTIRAFNDNTKNEGEGSDCTTTGSGDDPNLDPLAWYLFNSGGATHDVGSKQANAWGLYDMHGNVYEWCLDWYVFDLGTSTAIDPTGGASGTCRSRRGGGWSIYESARYCRSAYRYGSYPDNDDDYSLGGFRLVLPASDSASGEWTATGSMSKNRASYFVALLSSGKVLVVGGASDIVPLYECELYDTSTGTWSSTGSMEERRQSFSGTLLPDGKVLVAGGWNGSSGVSSCELYDPSTGKWNVTGSLAKARYWHTSTLLSNGKVLVAGGTAGASCELYNPSTGVWTPTGSMTQSHSNHTATLLPSGKVLVAGSGWLGPTFSSYCELYDPSNGTWSSTGSMANGRAGHTATILASGKILVAGGYNQTGCELYEPSSETWSVTGSMTQPRHEYAATLLPDNKVLVAGGSYSSHTLFTSSCEIYDPSEESWTFTDSMSVARSWYSNILLPSGKVLALGGNSNLITSSCEIYSPSSSTCTVTFVAGANGTISGTSPQTVSDGGNCTAVTAVPSTGYHFVNWTGTSGFTTSTANPLTVTNLTTDMTITANFAANDPGTFTVTFLPGAGGTVSGIASQNVASGTDCTPVTALPNTGYHFVNWNGDASSTSNPLMVTNVTKNMSITANFAINTYTLTYTAGTGGTISGTSPQTVNYGANGMEVTAVPDTNYLFASWSDNSTVNPRTDSNVKADISVTANFQFKDFKFTDNGTDITITGYTGAGGDITIPDSINGKPVTSIGNWAFLQLFNLTNIIIPDSVTSIGDGAFCSCTSLTNVSIPNSVTSIGFQAFSGCSSLTSVVIPNSVTSIGGGAFFCCTNLTSIVIPDGVTNIGDGAFSNCSKLILISVLPDNPNYSSSQDGVLFDKGKTVLIQCPGGKSGDYTIPGGVTIIEDMAFSYCSALTSITIPGSVTSIGDDAFYMCSGLTSIVIPDSVTSIGYNAFSYCSALTSITIPGSVTSIGNGAFSGCTSLTSIVIPDGVTSIGDGTFNHCSSLTNMVIRDKVTSIGEQAFSNCFSLTSVTIGSGVKNIGVAAFYGCTSLTSVVIPNSVTSIGYMVFAGCPNLNTISVSPDNPIYSSKDGVLFDKGKTILIQCPGGKIGGYAIPGGVISIWNGAFYGCNNLTGVYFYGDAPIIGTQVFNNCASGFTVYFLEGAAGFTLPTWQGYPSAIFTINSILTMAVTPNAYGTTNPAIGGYTVLSGIPQAISVLPKQGYKFKNWTATANTTITDTTALSTTATLWGNATVTANFEKLPVKMTMAVVPSIGGSTNPSVTQTVMSGDPQNISATSATGYNFTNWTSVGSAVFGNTNLTSTTVTLSEDSTVTANFLIKSYTVNFIAGTNGTLKGQTSQLVNHGTASIPVTAVPNSGYLFVNWIATPSENAAIPDPSVLTITPIITGVCTITANFAKILPTTLLTMDVSPENVGITAPAAGTSTTVNTEQEFNISATPANGYIFVKWTATNYACVTNVNSAGTTITLVADATVTANFAQSVTLTMAVSPDGGGTTNPAVGTTSVSAGIAQAITAIPATGYKFSNWSATVGTTVADADAPSTTVTLSNNATVTANFEAIPATASLTMALNPENGGTTAPVVGASTQNTQQAIPISATAADGYSFTGWTATGSAVVADIETAGTTVTIMGDATVTANFLQNFTLTMVVSPETSGTTNPAVGTHTISPGAEQTIAATAAIGHKFLNWTATADASLADATALSTTVTLTGDAIVTANFEAVPATAALTMAVNPDGAGTTTPAATSQVNTQQAVNIAATPAVGYHFLDWAATANATISNAFSASTTVSLIGDATITANFEADQTTAQLTMAVFPADSGYTSPAQGTTIAVNTGVETSIMATPAASFSFINWTASNANAVFADYSASSTTVTLTGNVTITANFEQGVFEDEVAVGKLYGLNISDIRWTSPEQTLANFAKKPKVYATYKDPVSKKDKTSTLYVVTKIEKDKAVTGVDCEWTAKIALLDKKIWTADKTRTTQQILETNQPVPLVCRLFVSGEDDKKVKVKDVDTHIDIALLVPEISCIQNDYGQPISIIAIGTVPQKVTIVGKMFGKSVPTAWMEYINDKGEVKQLKLKLDKDTPLKYKDAKGKPSCMDIDTGVSEFTVLIPVAEKLPKNWQAGAHNIVIDNKVCRATIAFQTEE